ncbi:SufS family cysteine desulfurase [Vibrio mimicus]|uniref:SufS family cysteine desulfurase n=1 Tax=Vibrio mimicus TaxID=674 RepID=UPI002F9552C9
MSDLTVVQANSTEGTSPWRDDFPTLGVQLGGVPLVYLDSAATAQTPQVVIERMQHFYQSEYASVHRGIHQLSSTATDNMEAVRDKVQHFIGAAKREEIVFTKGATEAINLVANSFLRPILQQTTTPVEIVISELEHHANIVPWQLLAEQYPLTIKIWPVNPQGQLDLAMLEPLLTEHTRLIALAHVSNVLGLRIPIEEVMALAKPRGIPVLIDGAQAVMHEPINVEELGCDFYVFSAHKLYGPTGVGVLYAQHQHLEAMSPWQGGGAMIDQVSLPNGTTYLGAPWKFEPGTPNIAGILGMGSALDYLQSIGIDNITDHEAKLMNYALKALKTVPNLRLFGSGFTRHGVMAFNLGQHHAYDVGSLLDRYGIAIRTGHHCAQPLLAALGESSVCRASIGMYSNQADIDALVKGLTRIATLLD